MIVTDLDDTLLRTDATLSARTVEVLSRARAKGAVVVLASGRMTRAMLPYAVQLGVTAPMIAYNGAVLAHPESGRPTWSMPVPAADARRIAELAEGLGLHLQAYCDDEYYFPADNEFSDRYAAAIGVRGRACGRPLTGWIDRSCDKLLAIDTPARIQEVLPIFRAELGGRLNMMTSRPHYLEFTHPKATKAAALDSLASGLGVTPDQIVAFGDGQNDVPMLQYAALSYAPKNAKPDVRAMASAEMPSNDDDGVARIVQALIEQGRIGKVGAW